MAPCESDPVVQASQHGRPFCAGGWVEWRAVLRGWKTVHFPWSCICSCTMNIRH
jgi:hypothetical protein